MNTSRDFRFNYEDPNKSSNTRKPEFYRTIYREKLKFDVRLHGNQTQVYEKLIIARVVYYVLTFLVYCAQPLALGTKT